MTVAELIEKLKACDPAALVVVSSDAEGNGFSPLHEPTEEPFRDIASDLWMTRDERAKCHGGRVVVLWPI